MARDDWFRNKDWNDAIEASFFSKLARARADNRQQYLRVQAYMLAESHPTVALRLLEHYFGLGDSFDLAQAHVHQATAFLSLDDFERAVGAYEAALAAEAHRPNVLTQAYLDLPLLIAKRKDAARYSRALELLEQGVTRLDWPVEHFCWHAAHALIAADLGRISDAREHARAALAGAAKQHSGLRYHPSVGLVGSQDNDISKSLRQIINRTIWKWPFGW